MAQYWGTGKLGAVQSVAYSGTAGTIANGVGAGTNRVRVVATTDCYIQIAKSPAPTGSADSSLLPGLSVEYFTINPGEKVSAIQVTSAGTLNVTEVS